MNPALLDSNIIIDHLNNIEEATDYLNSLPDWIISSLTVFEVLSGCSGKRSGQLAKAKQFFNFCSILSVDSHIAETASAFQRKSESKRKMADFIIAATATHNNLELATRNPSDFKDTCKAFQPYEI